MYEYPRHRGRTSQAGYFHDPYDDVESDEPWPPATATASVTPGLVIEWLRRGTLLIIVFGVIGGLCGLGYAVSSKPRYTAFIDLMIPPQRGQIVPNELTSSSMQSDAQLLDIASKLMLLKSGNVLRRTVDKLRLDDVLEFNGQEKGILSDLRALFDSGNRPAGDSRVAAMRALGKRITISREAGTYMASVGVWTRDPQLSADVATALVSALREEMADAEAGLAGEASSALSERLETLRRNANAAASAVAEFRQRNQLQKTADGSFVNAQAMTQLNQKLNDATSRLVETQSRYRRLSERSTSGLDASDTLDSPVLTALRSQLSTLQQQHDQLAMTYGARYPQLVTVQRQLQTLRGHIQDELARSLRAVKLEVEQAQESVDDLTKQVEEARGRVSLDDGAQVRLAELQRDMEAKALLYDTFLKRAGEVGEQERMAVSNLRVVTQPLPPDQRNWPPPTSLLTAGGFVAGLGLGAALALAIGFLGLTQANARWEERRA